MLIASTNGSMEFSKKFTAFSGTKKLICHIIDIFDLSEGVF